MSQSLPAAFCPMWRRNVPDFLSHGLQLVEDVPDLTERFRVCWRCSFFFYSQSGFQLVGKEGVFISARCLNRLFNMFNKQVKVFLSPSVPPLWIKDTRYKWSSAASDGCFAAGHLMCCSWVFFHSLSFWLYFLRYFLIRKNSSLPKNTKSHHPLCIILFWSRKDLETVAFLDEGLKTCYGWIFCVHFHVLTVESLHLYILIHLMNNVGCGCNLKCLFSTHATHFISFNADF